MWDSKKYFKAYYRKHLEKHRAYGRQQHLKLKQEVFAAYGGKCVCCGETELHFLTIDHIHGGGRAHMKSLGNKGKAGSNFYRWLRNAGYPRDKFQLLCQNCNTGRYRNGGTCPHKLKLDH